MKSEITQTQSSRDDHSGAAPPVIPGLRVALHVMGLGGVPSASDPERHDATSDCQPELHRSGGMLHHPVSRYEQSTLSWLLLTLCVMQMALVSGRT
jgi:hypothetical protein